MNMAKICNIFTYICTKSSQRRLSSQFFEFSKTNQANQASNTSNPKINFAKRIIASLTERTMNASGKRAPRTPPSFKELFKGVKQRTEAYFTVDQIVFKYDIWNTAERFKNAVDLKYKTECRTPAHQFISHCITFRSKKITLQRTWPRHI